MVGRPQRWDWSLQRNLKDRVEPCDEIGAVYRINCMDCDDIYIGETGRTTRVRCLEHKSHARCKRTDHSAAADHVLLEGHDGFRQPCSSRQRQETDVKTSEARKRFGSTPRTKR